MQPPRAVGHDGAAVMRDIARPGLHGPPGGGNLDGPSLPCQPSMRVTPLLILSALLLPPGAGADPSTAAPWGYRQGATSPPRQGNFCDDRESALEIARIFERFGPRTGFSALAGSPDCSTRVHGVTPTALLARVRVGLEGDGEYHVSFIEVRADDGTTPVLVTTRRFVED